MSDFDEGLADRVEALARQYDAKSLERPGRSLQDAGNARATAVMLFSAASAIRHRGELMRARGYTP